MARVAIARSVETGVTGGGGTDRVNRRGGKGQYDGGQGGERGKGGNSEDGRRKLRQCAGDVYNCWTGVRVGQTKTTAHGILPGRGVECAGGVSAGELIRDLPDQRELFPSLHTKSTCCTLEFCILLGIIETLSCVSPVTVWSFVFCKSIIGVGVFRKKKHRRLSIFANSYHGVGVCQTKFVRNVGYVRHRCWTSVVGSFCRSFWGSCIIFLRTSERSFVVGSAIVESLHFSSSLTNYSLFVSNCWQRTRSRIVQSPC